MLGVKQDFFTYLQEKMRSCVQSIDKDGMEEQECVLVFGSNLVEIIQKYIESVKTKRPGIKIVLVAQEQMINGIKPALSADDVIVESIGKFSTAVLAEVESKVGLENIDSVVYYSQEPIDLADENILEIASVLNEKREVNIYSVDRSMDTYKYNNISFYLKGIRLYNQINEFIDDSLNL